MASWQRGLSQMSFGCKKSSHLTFIREKGNFIVMIQGSFWNLRVKLVESNERLDPGIWCQMEQRLLHLALQNHKAMVFACLCEFTFTYVHGIVFSTSEYSWAKHECCGMTSLASKPTTTRSKGITWDSQKLLNSNSKLPKEGIWHFDQLSTLATLVQVSAKMLCRANSSWSHYCEQRCKLVSK